MPFQKPNDLDNTPLETPYQVFHERVPSQVVEYTNDPYIPSRLVYVLLRNHLTSLLRRLKRLINTPPKTHHYYNAARNAS